MDLELTWLMFSPGTRREHENESSSTHTRQSFMKTVPSATPPRTSTFPWWTTAAWPCRATRTSSCDARQNTRTHAHARGSTHAHTRTQGLRNVIPRDNSNLPATSRNRKVQCSALLHVTRDNLFTADITQSNPPCSLTPLKQNPRLTIKPLSFSPPPANSTPSSLLDYPSCPLHAKPNTFVLYSVPPPSPKVNSSFPHLYPCPVRPVLGAPHVLQLAVGALPPDDIQGVLEADGGVPASGAPLTVVGYQIPFPAAVHMMVDLCICTHTREILSFPMVK